MTVITRPLQNPKTRPFNVYFIVIGGSLLKKEEFLAPFVIRWLKRFTTPFLCKILLSRKYHSFQNA